MLKDRLAKKLKTIREEHNWTQEAAAELCDLSPRFWGKIERGEASASIETLEKLSAGLGVPAEELLKKETVPDEE